MEKEQLLDNCLYFDYPSEPIGGDNPYRRCCSCGASAPQINGELSGHFKGCLWVRDKKRELWVETREIKYMKKNEALDYSTEELIKDGSYNLSRESAVIIPELVEAIKGLLEKIDDLRGSIEGLDRGKADKQYQYY